MASEVATTTPELNEDQLTEMRSMEDALATLAQAGIEVTSVTDFGDGFLVMDKADFVNVKFVIVNYKIVPAEKSDFGSDFAVIRIITADGRKAILTDGSRESGLCVQIKTLQRRGVTGGVMCEKGLTVSEYPYEDPSDGKTKTARTYYLSGM